MESDSEELIRIDLEMVAQGLVSSRTKAQELVKSGSVKVYIHKLWKTVKAGSLKVPKGSDIQVEKVGSLKFVSRAGQKMENALKKIGFSPKDLRVLDMGISTGGFADCLLQQGADTVVGVDVGKDQLSAALTDHPKLRLYEGVNGRELSDHLEFCQNEKDPFDLVVMDVSFISMTKLLSELVLFLKPGGKFLSLVKPQFELTRQDLDKRGLVKEESRYDDVEKKVKQACLDNGIDVVDYFESGFPGRDGNREFFVYGVKRI